MSSFKNGKTFIRKKMGHLGYWILISDLTKLAIKTQQKNILQIYLKIV